MSKLKERTVKIISPDNLKGGWLIRLMFENVIDAILTEEYLNVEYPLTLSCTTLMESATLVCKHQKAIFTEAEVSNGKLYYEKLHLVNLPEHAPLEIYDITSSDFTYEGFHGIKEIQSFSISLFENFDIRDMIPELMKVISHIQKTFKFYTEIDSLKLLQEILDLLNISLQDIEFLDLSDFLEVKNGQVVYTKRISNEATVVYSNYEASYIEKSFIFQFDIGNLIEKAEPKDDDFFESGIIEISDPEKSLDDGYTLTLFGNLNIQSSSPKKLLEKAMTEIDNYAKQMHEFNLLHHEITVEPGD